MSQTELKSEVSRKEEISYKEWEIIKRIASSLSLLVEKKVYNPIDTIGDSFSPRMRVEALGRALRMIVSEDPNRLPQSEDVQEILHLLLDERKGKLVGSILASLALSRTEEKPKETGKEGSGVRT